MIILNVSFIFLFSIVTGCNQLFSPASEMNPNTSNPQADAPPTQGEPLPKGDLLSNDVEDEGDQDKSEDSPSLKDSSMDSSSEDESIELPASDWDTSTTQIIRGGEKFESLIEFIDDKENFSKFAQQMTFHPIQNTLHITAPLALDFKKVGQSKPLTIKTHGNNLIIAGASFENLVIDTSAPQKHSGHVVVFASGHDLPTINTLGQKGTDGNNAKCESTALPCVQIQDRETLFENRKLDVVWEEEVIEHIFDWNDSFIQSAWKENIKRLVHVPERDQLSANLCNSDQYSAPSTNPEIIIEGKIKLRQVIAYAKERASNSPKPRDSLFFQGTQGSDGQDSGNIKIFQLGKANDRRSWIIPGGQGGLGGMNLKTPPMSSIESQHLKSRLMQEELDLTQLAIKIKITGSCASEIGRRPQMRSKEMNGKFSKSSLPMTSGFILQDRILEFPAQAEGLDLDPLTPTHQPVGVNGKGAIGLHQLIAQKSTWEKILFDVLEKKI